MNKQLVSVAAVAAAATAMAVESQNVVGFIHQDVDPNIPVINLGICFLPTGEAQSFVATNSAFGNLLSSGDTFYEFDANSWDLTQYIFNGAGSGWYAAYADGSSAEMEGLSFAPLSNVYLMSASQSFNLPGQVRASGSYSLTFSPNDERAEYVFNIVNPFPVATTFADLEAFCSGGETIFIFNPGYWDLDQYLYNGAGQGWYAAYADGTAESLNDNTQVAIAAGQGSSFMPASECTWSKTLNY